MTQLVWRATFIDVDSEQNSDASCAGRLPRARSVPFLRGPVEDIFAEEVSYIAGLSRKFTGCSQARTGMPAAVEAQPLVQQASSRARLANRALSSLLLNAKVAQVKGDGAREEVALADDDTRQPSMGTCGVSPSAADGGSKSSACNIGSVGHPSLCARPCMYFATDLCANGDSCEYCHMTHTRRPTHLNRQHRELLHAMDCSRAMAVLVPIARAKAEDFDVSESSMLAMDRLAAACGVADASRLRLSREERALKLALNGMNLKLVLTVLRRNAPPNAPEVEIALEALLRQLRSVA